MEDSLVRPRSFSPSSIRSQLQKTAEPAASAETPGQEGMVSDKTDPLPRPGDDYKANARHGNKPEMTLHFVTRDFSYEGFSYADIERVRLVPGDKPGSGPKLIVRFNGSVVTEVTIEGRHLHSLYHWIGLHLVPWVWEHPAPAEFTDDKAAIIRKFSIDVVER